MYPKRAFHWIDNKEVQSASRKFFDKVNPATGKTLAVVARGDRRDAARAIASAARAHETWSRVPVIKRAEILREAVFLIRSRKEELALLVSREAGKPLRDANAEVGAAVECGFFFAGEGRRFSGEVMQATAVNRIALLVRESIGVGVLINPFNGPAAGIAWKLFPALLCGNAVILKSHEYTPATGVWYGKLFKEAGLPSGVLSVLQGFGKEVGEPLVRDPRVRFISLTGSVKTGERILKASAPRLAKVSIEAGGKNPFVVCDDADLEKAAALAVQAAFIDAGQRCAAATRIIVFSNVYEKFKKMFLAKVAALKVGAGENDDYGAIISEKRLREILAALRGALRQGAVLLTGGVRLFGKHYQRGFFMAPTVLERVSPKDEISRKELFGPVTILYRAKNFNDALRLVNDADFKLSAAVHTASIHRAKEFIARSHTGNVRVNGPTHGSEPHMPFGGFGLSGNGWREPGTKALDFYSEWKQVTIDHDPARI